MHLLLTNNNVKSRFDCTFYLIFKIGSLLKLFLCLNELNVVLNNLIIISFFQRLSRRYDELSDVGRMSTLTSELTSLHVTIRDLQDAIRDLKENKTSKTRLKWDIFW